MSDMVKLTGLWKNETKEGETFYAGNLGNARVLIFKNQYKEESKHPDLNLFIAPQKEKRDGE